MMTLDLYYSNFNEETLGNSLDKMYQNYLIDNEKCDEKLHVNGEKKNPDNTKVQTQSASKPKKEIVQKPNITDITAASDTKRNERPRPQLSLRSPPKGKVPATRRSEPTTPQSPNITKNNSHYRHSSSNPPNLSPPKKISPKELRTRTKEDKSASSSSLQISPRGINKVQSAIDKLQIKNSRNIQVQENKNNVQNGAVTINSPLSSLPPSHNESTNKSNSCDENVLKQQNVNNASSKPAAVNGKVYFKEENSENLSWNGETSFEDPETTDATSPKPMNQYSSSFLNFLSNN
jgi:hypothetical protein